VGIQWDGSPIAHRFGKHMIPTKGKIYTISWYNF